MGVLNNIKDLTFRQQGGSALPSVRPHMTCNYSFTLKLDPTCDQTKPVVIYVVDPQEMSLAATLASMNTSRR